MKDSLAISSAEAEAKPEEPTTIRLVIRAEIIPPESRAAEGSTSSLHPFAWIALAILAALVIWIAVSLLTNDARSTAQNEPLTRVLPSSALAPRDSAQAARTSEPESTESTTQPTTPTTQSTGTSQADDSATPLSQVQPEAAASALQTIRGTVRVAVHVTIDRNGKVVSATSHEPGPSKYFERISLDAARGWKFTPARSSSTRSQILRFSFTRWGVTATAGSD